MEKLTKVLGRVLGTIAAVVIGVCLLIEGYTMIMGFSHKAAVFDGAYIYSEEDTTVVAIFDGDEFSLYVTDLFDSYRVSYSYWGLYYNKGFFDRFLDLDDYWIKLPDTEKAGEFYADCKTYVASSVWGESQYIGEEEMKAIAEEGDGFDPSLTFYFTVQGDTLNLYSLDEESYFSIPFEKTSVITGDVGEKIEHLDTLWEYQFGE